MAAGKKMEDGEPAALSIGALSAAVGIPVETIRTWERRYGFPVAERKLSGHRVYPLSAVPKLRKISEAIARGHRAAEVVPASDKAIDALLASLPRAGARTPPVVTHPLDSISRDDMLDAARRFDAVTLKHAMEVEWARLPTIEFLEHRVAPFLEAVGLGWADGTLNVRHEHFASAVVADFLRGVRGNLDERAAGPVAVLTTLPGEMHGLGLQMSSLVFSLAGWRAVILGVNSPLDEIVAIAHDIGPGAVGLSCVQPLGKKALEQVFMLRKQIPRRIAIVLGGSGSADAKVPGVETLPGLAALDSWLSSRGA
jgi:methanogenic corrinoid protein MtbC1